MRGLFHTLSLRERILVAIFLWLGLAIWLGSVLEQFRHIKADYRTASSELKDQRTWSDLKDEIQVRLESALELVDSGKTYTSSELVGKVDAFARETNLSFDINSPTSRTTDIFDTHVVRIQFKKAGIEELIQFDELIRNETPYLGLERVRIKANKADPRFLDGLFVISSFERKDRTL